MTLKYFAGKIVGRSTDTKPTNVQTGMRFEEEDQNYRQWWFDGSAWFLRHTIDNDTFFDDFEDGTFDFASDGAISPNGKWLCRFRGTGGTMGVRNVAGVGNVFYQKEGAMGVGATTAGAAITNNTLFQDFEFTCRMRTIQQMSSRAHNSWETAWIVYRIPDTFGQINYYFVIKTSGCEFGKSDNIEGSIWNVALATPGSPTCTMGQWYNVKIQVQGNHHKCYVDGTLVIDYEDLDTHLAPSPSRQIQKAGYVQLYNEDAEVEFDSVRIVPLYPKSLVDYDQSVHNFTPLPSSNRKAGAWYGTSAATGEGLLGGILISTGASNAELTDDVGQHWSYTTSTTSGAEAGLKTNNNIFRRSHNLILRAKVKNPSSLTGSRLFIGFANIATLANSDDPLNNQHGLLVGYKSGAASFGYWGNNAQTTDTFATEGLATTASEWVNIYMELTSSGKITLRLNNRTPVVFTTTNAKPGVSTDMYLHAITQNGSAAARTVTFDYIDVEMSPGSNL